jgi:1-acyl-sn-glycerol-3-phosphate acyltransferase
MASAPPAHPARRALRQAWRGAGFGALTLGCGFGVLAGVTLAPPGLAKSRARDRWTAGWSRALLTLFGVDVVVQGDPGVPGVGRGRGRVVVANHRSIIDIAILLSLFGGALVSRGDLEGWPIVGPAARSAGTIFVDRGDKRSGARALEAMVERLRADDTICLFPEGTTFVDDEVRPFKPGACVAATRAAVPVVPVALAYPPDSGAAFGGESFPQHLGRLAATKRTRVVARVGHPVEKTDGERIEAFSERCRGEVARLLAEVRSQERGAQSGLA